MSSGVIVELFMDVLAGLELVILPAIDIEVLAGVTSNAFEVRMTPLEFLASTPLEEFSRPLALLDCATPFDCRPLALLDCACVLQTWIPSYHV